MAIRKVAVKAASRKGAPSKKAEAKVSKAKRSSVLKASCSKSTQAKRTAGKKVVSKKSAVTRKAAAQKKASRVAEEISSADFNSELAAEKVELVGGTDATISVEALKIGLLLAAIDGNCDENEIKKFKTIASACGGLSDAKISQIISQTQRRISNLEDAAKHGATEDEMVSKFMSEASNIGIGADCRSFVLWMSIAMVDGDYSSVERKAIRALQTYANRYGSGFGIFGRRHKSDISDIFLKRCEMILSGIYKADAMSSKRLMQNRMKSLQTLIEIAEA